MKSRPNESSAPVAPEKRPSAGAAMPPAPKPVDPAGPEEYTWPRGVWNFGNAVFAISILMIVTIVVITVIAL